MTDLLNEGFVSGKQDYKLSEKFQLRLGKFQIMPSDSNSIIPLLNTPPPVLPLTSTPRSKGGRSCHINQTRKVYCNSILLLRDLKW
jgi:hypothetical protein